MLDFKSYWKEKRENLLLCRKILIGPKTDDNLVKLSDVEDAFNFAQGKYLEQIAEYKKEIAVLKRKVTMLLKKENT